MVDWEHQDFRNSMKRRWNPITTSGTAWTTILAFFTDSKKEKTLMHPGQLPCHHCSITWRFMLRRLSRAFKHVNVIPSSGSPHHHCCPAALIWCVFVHSFNFFPVSSSRTFFVPSLPVCPLSVCAACTPTPCKCWDFFAFQWKETHLMSQNTLMLELRKCLRSFELSKVVWIYFELDL